MVAVLSPIVSEIVVTPIETLFGTSYTVSVAGEAIGYASRMENGKLSASSFAKFHHQLFTKDSDAIAWVVGQYDKWVK